MALLVFFLGTIIFFRLYSLQVTAYETYRSIAQNQHHIFQELDPERGEIYLKDGEGIYPLAINRELKMAYLVPKEVEDREKTIIEISAVLNLEEDEVRKKLDDPEDMFEILKHKLSEEEVLKISQLNISGVYLMPETFRYYPAGELASQIVGFVGSDGKKYEGRYGLEAYWEKELRGKPGNLSQERDAGGRWISIAERNFNPAQNGIDLILTIERVVQYEVERILKETVEKHGADSGSIIVMEPETGKVIAMANYPFFNPNEYSKCEDMSLFMNPSVSEAYECGSVFKAITMAMGINDGKVNPETVYYDSGIVQEAGYSIKNSDEKAYGEQTMTQVLEESLNTGAIYIEKLVGNKKFADYSRKFGFGEKTGIDLPGEFQGNLNNLKVLNSDIQFFTASFGQGITVTPLQLINAYAVLANGGKLMRPQIVERKIYPNGEIEEVKPQEIKRVVEEETAEKVSRMLVSVVENGHGKRAKVPGYLVGGKTGTAQVAKQGEKGYEEGLAVGSFVGFAPADDPRFAVLVKIYNPKDVQWAESTAAPTFGEVMKFLLGYYKISPTEEYDL